MRWSTTTRPTIRDCRLTTIIGITDGSNRVDGVRPQRIFEVLLGILSVKSMIFYPKVSVGTNSFKRFIV